MNLFCNEVVTFLNNLDVYIPVLLRDCTQRIIEKRLLTDIKAMLVYGNEYAILNRIGQYIVKHHCQVDTLKLRSVTLTLEDKPNKPQLEYLTSEYHMEFELNEYSLDHIKSIIANQTISGREFIFIIKNAEPELNRNLYLALRRLVDVNPSARFIITTTNITFLEKSLVSRCLLLNSVFPLKNILKSGLFQDLNLQSVNLNWSNLYSDCNYNIISFIQGVASNGEQLLWQNTVIKLMKVITEEKNQLKLITKIRECVYKLYHIGVRLPDISALIIREIPRLLPKKHQSKKALNNFMHKLVHHIANCDAIRTNVGNKDILVYERLFLGIYQLL